MAEKFNVTGEQRDDIDGQMMEIKRQLRLKNGSPIDPELVKTALQNIVEGKFVVRENENVSTKPPILVLIFGGEKLSIKALDGKRFIYNSKETFAYVGSDFVNWNSNELGISTFETPVQIHEIVQRSKFMDIFGALPGTWNQRWLSQNQIIEFCETFPYRLMQGGFATMFLIKKDENKLVDESRPQDNLLVVCVGVRPSGMNASVYFLENQSFWTGEHRYRVVSPKLTPQSL